MPSCERSAKKGVSRGLRARAGAKPPRPLRLPRLPLARSVFLQSSAFSAGRYCIHTHGSGCGLIGENFSFGEHIIFVKGFLQIVHDLQGVICVIVGISDKPAVTTKRLYKRGVLCIFQHESVVVVVKLESPDFFTLDNMHRDITEHFINMLKALGRRRTV